MTSQPGSVHSPVWPDAPVCMSGTEIFQMFYHQTGNIMSPGGRSGSHYEKINTSTQRFYVSARDGKWSTEGALEADWKWSTHEFATEEAFQKNYLSFMFTQTKTSLIQSTTNHTLTHNHPVEQITLILLHRGIGPFYDCIQPRGLMGLKSDFVLWFICE